MLLFSAWRLLTAYQNGPNASRRFRKPYMMKENPGQAIHQEILFRALMQFQNLQRLPVCFDISSSPYVCTHLH
jgi:hypothetical protein